MTKKNQSLKSQEVINEITSVFDESSTTMEFDDLLLELPSKLSKDLQSLATNMNIDECRHLVNMYYTVQKYRIQLNSQIRELDKIGVSSNLISYFANNMAITEKQIKKCLEVYVRNHPVGRWAISIKGIGPVIAAGLISNVDIEKANYSGQIMSYAGMQPNVEWNKGEKRPFNADFKSLLWNMSQCFIKNKNRGCVYGQLYDLRKEYEKEKNEAGDYAEQAKEKVSKVGKDTIAYKSYSVGKLPDNHINSRCQRWAIKIFISHLHYVMYRQHFGVEPVKPYVHAYLGHADMYVPENLNIMGWNDFYGKKI